MRKLWYFAFTGFFILGSCNRFSSKSPEAELNTGFTEETTISSAVVQESVLGTCLNCHNGTRTPDLSSVTNIRANISKIQSEVDDNQMPPPSSGYSPLTSCQKDILREWITDGMPDQSGKKVFDLVSCHQTTPLPPKPTPAPPILQMPLNYDTLTSQILQPRCLHCHNPQSDDPDAKDIPLSPYKVLAAGKLLGVDSAHSKLYKMVSRTDDSRMPPPEDSGPLPADQIEFIKRWIDAGHPEH